jgi:type I site-specific restriction endonuclease
MPDLNEAKTQALLINPQLEKAGWNLSDRSHIQFEVPVKGYDPTPWNGFTDFCLYHPDGTSRRIMPVDVVMPVDVSPD